MKKTVKPSLIVIPTCSIIANLGQVSTLVLTDQEIKIFNAYFYFLETQKVANELRHNEWYVCKTLEISLRKLFFVYRLPSKQKLLRGELTRKQFLDAPIKLHGFSTRLYHTLLNADVYNLNNILQMGVRKLCKTRGFGQMALLEVLSVLERKKCEHLFQD